MGGFDNVVRFNFLLGSRAVAAHKGTTREEILKTIL